jgi:Ca2+-binding RTX toxin-like protein
VRMIVDAAQLRAAEGMTFNGSAETDGRFWIFGGKGNDNITGGAGNDTIQAGLGKDYMNGGAGADVFTFKSAAESTGVNYDTIDGFVFGTDTLDLPGTHDSYEVVSGGLLSTATFDTDLATAMAATLGANEAVLFTATVGDLAGRLFLVVDQNGTDGYQSGEDFVIELANTSLPVGPIPDFIV